MPNHVTHRVRLHGSEEDCKRFYEQFFRDGGFDFETVLPQPECVKRTQSGSQASVWFFALTGTFLPSECRNGMPTQHQWGWVPRHLKTAVDVEKWLTEKDPKGRVFGEYAIQCLRETGFESWYQWCKHYWGTKSNAYQTEVVSPSEFVFQTAWSPPIPVLAEMAKRMPGIILDVCSYDKRDNFACVGQFNGRNDYRKVPCSEALSEQVYGEKRPEPEE
mgnify:FL=1